MNPDFLMLALRTPFEQLLPLPNAIRIALLGKEHLSRFNDDQLRDVLAWIDATIEQAVMQRQSEPGGDIVTRDDERDFDWLMGATENHRTYLLRDGTPFGFRDCYRVLALHKLGAVIEAIGGPVPGLLAAPVAGLMEALEAVLLADVLPDVESVETTVERAWGEGLRPDSDVQQEVERAKSDSGRKAANIRHVANRAAKDRALELYRIGTYSTIEAASKIIGDQVCRSPVTVKNWIFAARRKSSSE